MRRFLIYLLTLIMIAGTLGGCSFFDDEDAELTVVDTIEDFPETKKDVLLGSKDMPAKAVEGFEYSGYEGTINYKVTNIYVGDECDKKLKDLGEDTSEYFWRAGTNHVLYQVEVKVDKLTGATKKYTCSDVIFTDIYKKNKKDKYGSNFSNVGLADNAKVDINQNKIELKPSEDAVTLYQMIEIPTGAKSFYSKLYDADGNAFWVYYPVENM